MAIANAASGKKALDIRIIDMRKVPSVCDYFVIASGTSTTQVKAIADNITKKLRERQERLWHVEGQREALWVLLDYSDVVAHVFYDETRRFYDLEKLWGDVPQERYREVRRKKPVSRRVRRKENVKSRRP